VTRPHPHPANHPDNDNGSVTPLIIGMMFCLLFFAAGITAAGSAFLGHQGVQHRCDGAATTAADTAAVTGGSDLAATQAAIDYLAVRSQPTTATANVAADGIHLTCQADIPITLGALFGQPTLHITLTAVGRPTYTLG
jgi:hypothetical protein